MTHAGRKDGTDISGAEVLCSRISAAYKDDTSKSHCLYLNRRQILAIKKKNDWSGTCWHTHTVWVQRPGCKSAPGTLPHSSCRCCQMQQKSQKYNLPKKKKSVKVANALQLLCPSFARNHGSVFVAAAPNQQNLKILPKPNPLFTSPTFSGTFPTYRQRQGICHKSGMGRSIKANHAGLSD